MEGIKQEDTTGQEEEKREQKTDLEEGEKGSGLFSKMGLVSKKELQLALERNKTLEKDFKEMKGRLKKLEKAQENATVKEEKMKIEMELQVTLERNKSLEKECGGIRERLEKLEQKQDELRSQRETLLLENITMKEERRIQENQSQSVEQQFFLSQLEDLRKSKEEEKAKVKELEQKQRDLRLQKVQLQEKIEQRDQDKKQNDEIKAEILDIQSQLQSLNQDVQNAAEKEKVAEDRQKQISNICENVDQVRSMYKHKIEELREEMTRLTSRENMKEVLRQVNEDQSVMTSDVPVLLQKIRPFFVFCVNPLNVLVIIHSHGSRVLVEQDFVR